MSGSAASSSSDADQRSAQDYQGEADRFGNDEGVEPIAGEARIEDLFRFREGKGAVEDGVIVA